MHILRKALPILVSVMAILAPGASIANQDTVKVRFIDRPFLEFIGYMEGPDGYDEVTNFAKSQPMRPASQMTLDEVLEFQMLLRQQGSKSTAMGRYQTIYKTLLHLKTLHGIDGNMLFDKSMQDHLARILMDGCGFYDTETPLDELGNCLAGVWAAIPMMTGPKRGKSRYHSSINAALTTPDVMAAVLRNRFTEREVETWRPTKAGFNLHSGSYHADDVIIVTRMNQPPISISPIADPVDMASSIRPVHRPIQD